MDFSDNAYVTGITQSSDFPTANPIQAKLAGSDNAFVAKLNWDASTSTLSLVYSTYLGGSSYDSGEGIALDSSDNAYVVGYTESSDFPTAQPLQTSLAGYSNAFVAELNWAASTSTLSLVYSTYLGGDNDSGAGIAVDSSGNAYVAGNTAFNDLPTANPIQASSPGMNSTHAFVAEIGTADSPGIAFGPGAFTFGELDVGITSGVQSVILTAAGSQPLNVFSITPGGDFALVTTATSCPYTGGTVPSGSTCTLDVTFTPSAGGTRTGSLSVTDNASGSPQTVPLAGTGISTFSLSSDKSSGSVIKGANSTTFTIAAATSSGFTGNIALACTGISPATCTFNPTSVTPGQKSTLTVSGLSALSGNSVSFTVTGTSSGQTASLALTILLADFVLSTSATGATVAAGQSATYNLSVTPVGGFDQQVSLSCSGAPPVAVCSISPAAVTLDGIDSVHATVTVTTTARSLAPEAGWLLPEQPTRALSPGSRGY